MGVWAKLEAAVCTFPKSTVHLGPRLGHTDSTPRTVCPPGSQKEDKGACNRSRSVLPPGPPIDEEHLRPTKRLYVTIAHRRCHLANVLIHFHNCPSQ